MKKKIDRSAVKVKKKHGARQGRGFSIKELAEAGINPYQAKSKQIPVDKRRKSLNPNNIETIKQLILNK
jgi:large subunit ribosomal protein L13e